MSVIDFDGPALLIIHLGIVDSSFNGGDVSKLLPDCCIYSPYFYQRKTSIKALVFELHITCCVVSNIVSDERKYTIGKNTVNADVRE